MNDNTRNNQIELTTNSPQTDETIYKKPYLVIDGCLNE